jgi:cyclic lactone autoinducer peptide
MVRLDRNEQASYIRLHGNVVRIHFSFYWMDSSMHEKGGELKMIKALRILKTLALSFAQIGNGSVSVFHTHQPKRPESMK